MERESTYFHLAPATAWNDQQDRESYLPESYATDGFIHLTIGTGNLIDVANRYYRGDARDYVALELAAERISAPVRFDDDSGIYPHVHGALNTDAVTTVRRVIRDSDGSFVGLE